MSVPPAFMKKLMADKEFTNAVAQIIQTELQSNMTMKNEPLKLRAKGKTSIFGQEIKFVVYGYISKFQLKWGCKAKHPQSGVKVETNDWKSGKTAGKKGLQTLMEKLQKENKLQNKEFGKQLMKKLQQNGWTLQRMMKIIQNSSKTTKTKSKL